MWAKTVPLSSWVLIVLPLWKYELILNEIDRHVRRVLIFVHEWGSTTNKKANIYFLYCYEAFGLQASAVQTPFDADFQSHNSSDCESFLFSCCFGKFSHLFLLSSVHFQAVSIGTAVYAWVCWIITAIVSSVLIRFDWSWLRIVARSSFFFFYCLESPPRATECSLLCLQAEKSVTTGGEPVMWTAAERRRRRCERKDFLFRTMTCFCRPFSSR